MATTKIAYIDLSALVGGTATSATREAGIDYSGVETLNIALGKGDDVFNIQGTSIHTKDLQPGATETVDLAGVKAGGVTICDPGCVAKTYPGFWEDLEKVKGQG